jgi:CSLREA domain-containing protein
MLRHMVVTSRRAGTSRLAVALAVAATLTVAAPALADITVTTTSDTGAVGDGQCSLREAIALSTDCPGAAASGTTTIHVPAGTYQLADQLSVTGTANLDIRGASTSSPAQTTISRASDAPQFRLMLIAAGAVVKLDGLTLTGGRAPDGAAGATAGTNGGNGAPGVAGVPGGPGSPGNPGDDGGAIHNSGSLIIDHSVIENSTAGTGGAGRIGGDGGDGGVGTVASGKQGGVGANGGAGGDGGAGGRGGGVYNTNGASLTITNSVFDSDMAGAGGPGAAGGAGGDGGGGAPDPNCCGTGATAGNGGPGGAMGDGGDGGAIFNAGTASVSLTIIRFSHGGMGGSFGIINVGRGGIGGNGGDTSATFNGTGGKGGNGGAAGAAAAGGFGGGILTVGSLTLNQVTMHNDAAGDGSYGAGGGAAGNGGDGGAAVNGGVAGTAGTPAAGGAAGCGGSGGAIFVGGVSLTLTITETTIWNNGAGTGGFGGAGGTGGNKGAVGGIGTSTAGAAGGAGGCGGPGAGIELLAGSATITNSTIGENGAGTGGIGGIGGNGSPDGSAGGNAGNGGAGGRAGALLTIRPLALNAVTVNANRAGAGGLGGTIVGTGTPNGNPGSNGAAGISTQFSFQPPATVTFRNTLVRGLGPAPNCYTEIALTDQGGNLDYPDSPCPGIAVDPQLDPIGDYGGPTRTYRLHPGSPAIEGGNDAGCQAHDQRGLLRPQGAHCDIGSVEAGAPPVCQDVGPVHVPYGTKTNVQLACSDPTGLPVYQYVSFPPLPQHGEVRTVDPPAGLWSYEPDPGFSGDDTFAYYGSSGNGDSAPRTVTVHVTAPPAAPDVTGTTPASPASVTSPKVTGTAPADTTVTLYPTADCSGPAAGSGSAAQFAGDGIAVGPLAEGTTTFHALAGDADGIQSPCSSTSVAYTYDVTGPVVTIDTGPAGPTSDTRPVFGFSSPEPLVTFTCSIDAGAAAFGPCTGANTHQPMFALAFGAYTFRVRGADPAGNATVATRAFTVGLFVPDTVIVRHPKARVLLKGTRARVRFTFRATLRGATFRCSLDRARARRCRSPKRYRVKSGRHRFRVWATAGGKTDPTPASFRFRVVRSP